MTLLQKLSEWQKAQMAKEGLADAYMVLPFKTIKAIAESIPRTEAELLNVKGIGSVKVRKYGKDILALTNGQEPAIGGGQLQPSGTLFAESDAVNALLDAKNEEGPGYASHESENLITIDQNTGEILGEADEPQQEVKKSEKDDAIGVGAFLEQLNHILGSYFSAVRVRGEVIGFKRNQNGHAYFELKDASGIVRCSVFRGAYDQSGVDLSDGVEVIITGKPSHHAQYGFSFIGERIELAGEGALKKAYDALKKKLSDEGLFDQSLKREVPELPTRVGLITSPTGAAIGDFTTNVGTFGYAIRFHPSTVEGSKAVKELLHAIEVLAHEDVDVLVITRGGGSLESLQAFNNENVVRALRRFPAPVVAGIGHEQDETLSTLAADVGVSTPTAAARAVRESWDQAVAEIGTHEQFILGAYQGMIRSIEDVLRNAERETFGFFDKVINHARNLFAVFDASVDRIGAEIMHTRDTIKHHEKFLAHNNPERQLSLGYSITKNAKGKIMRHKKDLAKGDVITTQLSQGEITSTIQ